MGFHGKKESEEKRKMKKEKEKEKYNWLLATRQVVEEHRIRQVLDCAMAS